MAKTVTLRLDDPAYQVFRTLADRDHRPISNFIVTAARRFVEEHEVVDEFEMEEIRNNRALNTSLKRGVADAKAGRGRFA